MKINLIKESYVNISKNIYNSDFINLANIKNEKINFDENTLFLSKEEKEKLNKEKIQRNDECIYLFKYKGSYGLVANLDIQEYIDEKIKCHELVLPDTIQGMMANSYIYNTETAPVFIIHKEKIDLKEIIDEKKYSKEYNFNEILLYQYSNVEAKKILKLYENIEKMYVADGHHRLYTTSIMKNKKSVLSCFLSFCEVDILSINRVIKNIDKQAFEKAKRFMENMLEISKNGKLSKGYVRVSYQNESFLVKLKDVNGDLFWNNDIFRLNTQIISTAFRILNFSNVEYILDYDMKEKMKVLEKDDVLLEPFSLSLEEFSSFSDNGCILPPKSTCFTPKFPSFLIFKKYR